MTFIVKHLKTNKLYKREHIFLNPNLDHSIHQASPQPADPTIQRFHRALPHYSPTPLIPLPALADELGISHVFIKDESLRFGLPSFKILGASYSVCRAVCSAAGLTPNAPLEDISHAARSHALRLVTCSAGNWGRAVARMAHYLDIDVTVFLFDGSSEETKDLIRAEGATVIEVHGSYDDSITAAIEEGAKDNALLVMDTSWDGFEEIPQWVVDGYSTMLNEVDSQLQEACGRPLSMCVVPVGVGSIAQAVVAHNTSKHPSIRNFAVEPEAAPCLMESLRQGSITPISTGHSIMPGMNCGTVSFLAWPVLRAGVYASVVVSDADSDDDVRYLKTHGINAGPCGAATVAAARMLRSANIIGGEASGVLVLFNTEGQRYYANVQ